MSIETTADSGRGDSAATFHQSVPAFESKMIFDSSQEQWYDAKSQNSSMSISTSGPQLFAQTAGAPVQINKRTQPRSSSTVAERGDEGQTVGREFVQSLAQH